MFINLSMDSNHINKKIFMLLAQILGVSLILIIPGLVPQPEPYFDLTPIKIMHTKIFCKNILFCSTRKEFTKNQTYCTYFFQRLTSG